MSPCNKWGACTKITASRDDGSPVTALIPYWKVTGCRLEQPPQHIHTHRHKHTNVGPFINDVDTLFNIRLNPKMFQNKVKQAELLRNQSDHSAKELQLSKQLNHTLQLYHTSSTRPKPPTPSVSIMLKSVNLRLEKKAFSASCLKTEQMVMYSLNAQKMLFPQSNSFIWGWRHKHLGIKPKVVNK